MGARRKSREQALQVLYQMEANHIKAGEAFLLFQSLLEGQDLLAFTEELVSGVEKNKDCIDGIIKEHSKNWRIERMTLVDRNILRLAVFELLFRKDIPPKVTLNEAINLGKKFSTRDSGSFINGVLDSVHQYLISSERSECT
jgi:transcription antitermination protein NusB